MSVTILRADARSLPLPDASVDLVVASPPYFQLRSYTDGGEHYDGQIGSEATPREYIAALLACTAEWVRVLKPSGSLWVNLGDKYSAFGGAHKGHGRNLEGHARADVRGGSQSLGYRDPQRWGVPAKSLIGLPWRYAIGCIDDLGLILRAEVVWSKPNGLPESVQDRVRRSHEQWFHFTRRPRYFSAVDEIREVHLDTSEHARRRGERFTNYKTPQLGSHTLTSTMHSLGKLPGSVWEIPSEPLTVPAHLGVDHFAAFPTEWPRRIIQGWSPSGICVECGEGRRPVVDRPGLLGGDNNPESRNGIRRRSTMDGGSAEWRRRIATPDRIIGEHCACPHPTAPTRPAIVVDPFGGTGTTALVADALGRHGISIDRSADYCRLAQWRTSDPGQRAKALGVPKPPVELDGQRDLFADLDGAA